VSKPSDRRRLGTEEDLLRAYDAEGFAIGIPVRPPKDEPEQDDVDDENVED
jgi:hypothetical protein